LRCETYRALLISTECRYERVLENIDDTHREHAFKALQFLAFSARPVSLAEVAEMAVINVEGSTSFNPDEDRLYDPNEIIKYCSSLVSVSTAQSRPVYLARNNVYGYTIGEAIELRLAHFSVKEFLISEHAVYSFRMSDELANISLTRACLAMLLHFDSPEPEFSENPHDECTPTGHGEAPETDSGGFEGITLNRIPDLPNLSDLRAVEKFPFVKYAAQYWITHYLALGVSAKNGLHDLCLRLFDCHKSPYINWLRFFSPGQPFEPPKNLQRGWISPIIYCSPSWAY